MELCGGYFRQCDARQPFVRAAVSPSADQQARLYLLGILSLGSVSIRDGSNQWVQSGDRLQGTF